MTSEPPPPEISGPEPPAAAAPGDRSARRFVYGTWGLLTIAGFWFVAVFAPNSPVIDEWEFVPALLGEEPFPSWLWKLHNEHRFPLPRAIYYGLFRVTHDFRAGCFVSLAGVSILAMGMVRLARHVRGRVSFSDAFFPLTLLHWGNYENLLMGYQLCFMAVPLLAGLLLAVILTVTPTNLFRRGAQAGLLTAALVLCGAGGLAFGPPMVLWLFSLAARLFASPTRLRTAQAACLAFVGVGIAAYVGVYFQGYARPDYHPPCPGIGSALVVMLQALSTAFGPAALGVWPEHPALRPVALAAVVAVALAVALLAAASLIRWAFVEPERRPRALGLFLLLSAVAAEAFGIGWGRSGFIEENGVCRMGLAMRYGWIVWPALGGLYFLGVSLGSWALAGRLPAALFVFSAVTLPANMVTGYQEAVKRQLADVRWAADVRAGLSADELVEKYYPNWPDYLQDRIRVGVRLLRQNGVSYYGSPPGSVRAKGVPAVRSGTGGEPP